MKKVYVVLAAAMMATTAATAQVKLGVEGGLNINNLADHYTGPTNKNMTKFGFHAGLVSDIGLSDHFSVAPALRYSMKGGEFDWEYNNGPIVVEKNDKLTFHYIELPVNIVYKTGMEGSGRFLIGAGPYVAYMVNAQNKWYTKTEAVQENGGGVIETEDKGAQRLSVGNEADDVVKGFDWGAQAFVGYQFPMGAFVKVGSQLGFQNTVPKESNGLLPNPQNTPANDGFMQKNYNFFVTLGYMFGGK